MEFKSGPVDNDTKATGLMIKLKGTALCIMRMETSSKASGKTTKQTAMASTNMQLEHPSKDTGSMIPSMALAYKDTRMAVFSKESTKKGRNVAMGISFGVIKANIAASGATMRWKEREHTHGRMVENTEGNG